MKWKLGATTRPWHESSFDEACAAIAEAGYTDVAIYANKGVIPLRADSSPEEIEETLATVERYGLTPSMLLGGLNLGGDIEESIENYRRLIDVAAQAGATYLLNTGVTDPAVYDRYFETMRRTAPYAGEKGVEIQLKPHGGIGLTGKGLREAAERVGHPAFTICYDPGNIIFYTKGEARPEPDVHDVAPLVTSCIIKDCIVVDGKPDVWIQPTTGWVDFESVLGTLIEAGFEGPFYVECLGGHEKGDIDRRAKETYDWLVELLGKFE